MDGSSLRDLNKLRKSLYYKDPIEENFLSEMNRQLMPGETGKYRDYSAEFPFIFVFGLPRSGTTLMGQLISHCFDVGYINNLMARFWLAPLTGIRLSRILLGDDKTTDFQSNYATTNHLTDIHEFGYFWRHWLKKETVSDIVHAREKEQDIDWDGLKKTLLNVQHEFGKAMVFKNLFGAYHIEKFLNLMDKALFVYIERDPLDVAISILDARRKFYNDSSVWWSSYLPEYDQIKELPYMEQIAGQVYYLRKLYQSQIQAVKSRSVVMVSYRDVCTSPSSVLKRISQCCDYLFDYELRLVNQPPADLEYRRYSDRVNDKDQFETLLKRLER